MLENITQIEHKIPILNSAFCRVYGIDTKTKLNSVALVHERTIPTEQPPPVDEVSANFGG